MPTPDDVDEVDDILFDEGSLEFPRPDDVAPPPPVAEDADGLFGDDDPVVAGAAAAKPASWRIEPPPRESGHPVAVDAVDAALFGVAASSAPVEDAPPLNVPPDVTTLVEEEAPTQAAMEPLIVDDHEPAFGDEENDEPGDEGVTESGGDRRGRRLALVAAAFLGLVVIAGATIGVMAFTGSDDSRPAVKTEREVTTTTAATTTTTAPPPTPAPDTAPPAANPPVTSAARRTPATTRSSAPQTPAATQPAPPQPPPPEPPPPPPDTTTPPTLPLP